MAFRVKLELEHFFVTHEEAQLFLAEKQMVDAANGSSIRKVSIEREEDDIYEVIHQEVLEAPQCKLCEAEERCSTLYGTDSCRHTLANPPPKSRKMAEIAKG